MKFRTLKSIAHNLAHSYGSGISLLAGEYNFDVYEEALQSELGSISVDFLAGKILAGTASDSLTSITARFPQALAILCERHGCTTDVFASLTARYGTDRTYGAHCLVSLEDQHGRRSSDRYYGFDGAKQKRWSPPGH